MRVLTVYAHPNPHSLCHAILEQFTQGLAEAGHESEVVDLYKIDFDPVFRLRDYAGFVHEGMPADVLERMDLKQQILDGCGGPVRRWIASRWLRRHPEPTAMARLIRKQLPKDILVQQEKIARAQGLAFIAPVFWCHFPAILKGWFERVFNYGFAFALTPEGWHGEAKGRVPLLRHEKALVVTPTLFREDDYRKAGLQKAMTTLMDDWGLRYPGIKKVEHVYFYYAVDRESARGYIERAHRLGVEFAS
jgi:NAD(P)H dehydrogenase (quinone)